jgi:hypothetical protein
MGWEGKKSFFDFIIARLNRVRPVISLCLNINSLGEGLAVKAKYPTAATDYALLTAALRGAFSQTG